MKPILFKAKQLNYIPCRRFFCNLRTSTECMQLAVDSLCVDYVHHVEPQNYGAALTLIVDVLFIHGKHSGVWY